MVIGEIPGQHAPQMPLAEHDRVVQTLASDDKGGRIRTCALRDGSAAIGCDAIPLSYNCVDVQTDD